MAFNHIRLVEDALRELPNIKHDYEVKKLQIDALALSGPCMYDERVDGCSEGQRIDKYLDRYDDPQLTALKGLFDGIYDAYCTLETHEQRIVALKCWRSMDVQAISHELRFSKSSIYRSMNMAYHKLYYPISQIKDDLHDWKVGRLK